MSDTENKNKSPLMLTVSGLRGIVGKSLTPQVATRYSCAFAKYLMEVKGESEGEDDGRDARPTDACPTGQMVHVIVARDSRPSGQMVENAVVSGLLASGCKVTRLGIVSTPGAAVMVKHLSADGGLVISASHNPIQWNGIKPLVRKGLGTRDLGLGAADKGLGTRDLGLAEGTIHHPSSIIHQATAPPPAKAQRIIDNFNNNNFAFAPATAIWQDKFNDFTARVHRDIILKHIDAKPIREANFKVALDSVRGAGAREAIAMLDSLGAFSIPYYKEPTGLFPRTPEPTRENLASGSFESLMDGVKLYSADVGFAQDPDADRLAIVDEKGRYIGEEYTLALCAKFLLSKDEYGKASAIAANLSTSRMIDDIVNEKGASVIRTPVGEANVALAMRENGAIVGGEGNGGIIYAPISYVRDSILGIAAVLALMAKENKPLSEIVDNITPYKIIKEKVDLPGSFKEVQEQLKKEFLNQKIDFQDGIRIDFKNKWLHVRPSNTEPIVRIIAEAQSEDEANALIKQAKQVM